MAFQFGWVVAGLAVALAGCAAAPKAVAPRFHGVWVSADPGQHSWLEIQAHRVTSFAVTQSNGRCASTDIDIVAQDRLNAPVSSLGTGEMSVRMSGSVLVISGKYATLRFMPASRESICQSGGTYLPGAPYPKQAG
ncbi:MAG: hypothetical protein ACLPV8_24370 [Steroidobacteraceae bacterium]